MSEMLQFESPTTPTPSGREAIAIATPSDATPDITTLRRWVCDVATYDSARSLLVELKELGTAITRKFPPLREEVVISDDDANPDSATRDFTTDDGATLHSMV